MVIRSIIALFMGLVIQLSQVQPCWASAPTKSCAENSETACCCGGYQSCPCASESDSDQKPAPSIPAAPDLKPLISKAPETHIPEASATPPAAAEVPAALLIESINGYAGVPLSVAFCSFVI